MGTPVDFETNGTVREERGFASSTYLAFGVVVADARYRELDVEQADGVERAGDVLGDLADPSQRLLAQRARRNHTGGVARVDARALDVLHHAAEQHVIPVRYGVDVQFDRVVENWSTKIGLSGETRTASSMYSSSSASSSTTRIARPPST